MPIWSAEIKELQKLYESFKGQLPELEKELGKLIKADDENMILLYSRRCLEVIITDLCECELNRERGTEPLKGIIDKLKKEKKIPGHLASSMYSLNDLSTYGTHPKEFDPEQVKPVLVNLDIIIKWYLKYKDAQGIGKQKTEESKNETKVSDDAAGKIQKSKKRLILLLSGLTLVVAIVVVALFVFNMIGGGRQIKGLEKSIAVLPFIDDSPETNAETTSFANGLMEEILINLQMIKEFRVPGRTSVEQYRNLFDKSLSEKARELNVNYIIEGSVQKYGDKFRLRVQLIRAKGKETHLWAKSFEQEINSTKDIFNIQSQIAQAIANELETVITPEEKLLIIKTPTASLTAYDFFQRGREEHWKYILYNDSASLKDAEGYYYKALEYDSTFAQAYTGLAWVYWNKNIWKEYFLQNFMDSVLSLSNRALSYDDKLSEAYIFRGLYFKENGELDLALAEYNKAIKYNPNDWWGYVERGSLYYNLDDLVNVVDNFYRAVELNRGQQLRLLLRIFGSALCDAGFPEKNKIYLKEAVKLDGDSLNYYYRLGGTELHYIGNFKDALEYLQKAYALDSNNIGILKDIGYTYMFLHQYSKSLEYYKKGFKRSKDPLGIEMMNEMHRIGYSYWQMGYKVEAKYYFNKQIEYCNRSIEAGRYLEGSTGVYYDLAGVYAFIGDKDKAYVNLRIFNQKNKNHSLWIVTLIKNDPLFDSIRNEEEFQQIVSDIEAKYQAEHERVRIWLEENDML
jgi:TolB-like protein/Tfp pilus assembly protein PilF